MLGVGVVGDGDVVGGRAGAVYLHGETVRAGSGGEDAGALVGGGFVAEFRDPAEGRIGRGGRNAVVDDVDDATDGGAAVEQGRRAAEDLDALDEQRLNADVVIGTDVRRVEGTDAVFQHAHAFAAETADDRPAGAGPECGAAQAGRGGEGCAERGGGAATEFIAGENGSALGELEGGFAIQTGGDDEGIEIEDFFS